MRALRNLVCAAVAALALAVGARPLDAADFAAAVAAYERGEFASAFEEFLDLAEEGNAKAQNNLALMYASGKGVEQDYGAAVRWYREAAEQGNLYAQGNLAVLYENGKGVAQDFDQAARWHREAARGGNTRSQRQLGMFYFFGRGVRQDYVEAFAWFHLAAVGGDDVAHRNREIAADRLSYSELHEARNLAQSLVQQYAGRGQR